MYCTLPPCRRFVAETNEPRSTLDSIRSRSTRAPALSSGSLRFPHFGLCTHDGQPAVHGQRCSRSGRVLDPVFEAIEPPLGDADAARVAVVDEDRRAPGLVVDVRREAADVPAIAHRPQRQECDQAVLGRVQRAEELRHLLEAFEVTRLRAEPDCLRLEGGLGHEHRNDVDRGAVAHRLPRVGDDLLRDRDAAEVQLEPEALRRLCSDDSMVVSDSFFGCVYQSTRAGTTTATRSSSEQDSTRYCSPRWR